MSQGYNPTLLEKGLKGLLLSQLEQLKLDMFSTLCTVVPSAANNEKYAWMGQPPQMSDLTNTSQINFSKMTDTSYTLTNKTWASAVVFNRDDLADDQLGGMRLRIAQMAQVAGSHKEQLVSDAMINGTSSTLGLTYENVAFFSASHTARASEGGTQSNLYTGSGTSTAQFGDDFNGALARMINFKGENGLPMFLPPSDLAVVIPAALRRPAVEALGASIVVNTTNVQVGGLNVRLLINPFLTDANDWYLFNIGGAFKPFIFQEREPLKMEMLEDQSAEGIIREQFIFKARARYNVGYSLWQTGVKITNS